MAALHPTSPDSICTAHVLPPREPTCRRTYDLPDDIAKHFGLRNYDDYVLHYQVKTGTFNVYACCNSLGVVLHALITEIDVC